MEPYPTVFVNLGSLIGNGKITRWQHTLQIRGVKFLALDFESSCIALMTPGYVSFIYCYFVLNVVNDIGPIRFKEFRDEN